MPLETLPRHPHIKKQTAVVNADRAGRFWRRQRMACKHAGTSLRGIIRIHSKRWPVLTHDLCILKNLCAEAHHKSLDILGFHKTSVDSHK